MQPLVGRSINAAHRHIKENNIELKDINIPTWGIVLLVSTVILFLSLDFMIEYAFGRIVPTLVMVESPQALLFEPIKSDDPDAPLVDSKTDIQPEPELLLIKQQPITSSLRSTMKHLKARAGKFSRFRGLSMYIMSGLAIDLAMKFLGVFVPRLASPLIASVICAQFSLAWTHIVISEASPLPWYKRFPSMSAWKKVAGPTALYALAKEATIVLPTYLAMSYGIMHMNEREIMKLTNAERSMVILQGLSVAGLALALGFLVLLPANVTLTRVQASLLAEDQESIVPFDRTFGGKVVPEIVGGKGVVGMLDAWKTFDWNSRVRLLKTYGKVVAMETALSVLFITCVAGEIVLILGDDINKFIASKNAVAADEVHIS